eukprot:TRINITY_DN1000_c0_g1_i1.p1 TRINITY_DN1000_c0_g1~~TRINITY_DN1000_c0_g1_i1.p1  ORF type:complete len:513 (+),score=178.79 TRINITY_DN1000_c0_g1_i1:201-1541(+)
MNQMICFSYAPFASLAAVRYGGSVIAQSEVIFFVTYLPMSFVGSYIVDRYGLRSGLVFACLAQTLGAWVRWSSCFYTNETTMVYLGQGLASLGMCVFVNTPPRLSTSWFPSAERTLSTNIAVNANAAGAALAYLFAPLLVSTVDDFPRYNAAIATLCTVCCMLTIFFFKSHPDWNTPDLVTEYDWSQWISVLSVKGFGTTLLVFAVSECVINTMSTLLAKLVRPNGFSRAEADVLGAEFLLVCMAGGILFGSVQHRWQLHRNLAKCMLACSAAMLGLRFMLASESGAYGMNVAIAVFFAALFLGPLQATCNELGVECAFPVSENTVSAIQQLVGNFVSALVIPIITYVHSHYAMPEGGVGVRGHVDSWWHFWAMPEVIIAIMLLISAAVLFTYDGDYRRLTMEREVKSFENETADSEDDDSDQAHQHNGESIPIITKDMAGSDTDR